MKKQKTTTKNPQKQSKALLNSLRTLGIILGLFLAIFALDSSTTTEFLIQLIPGLLIITATALSWKSPRYSGLAFITFGIISIFFFNTYQDIEMFLIITTPPIIIGIFFYISFYLGVNKNIVK
jgi:hypothetical protein